MLKDAMANVGSVSVSIDARQPTFFFYEAGTSCDPSCSQAVDQAVLVVSRGSWDGEDRWLVKNRRWFLAAILHPVMLCSGEKLALLPGCPSWNPEMP
ncbi:cathepsin S-like [Rissa tridactyla]|uniref:cathepsin S-like n=1 Tax=Rissa tridactyla TaxID=75485 RepID=UPI0023BAEB4D|nr:cathepsin S-like [Rissa tridactyla]